MHIPDGYLGPQTYGALYLVMTPLWYWSSRILKKTMKARQAAFLALGAAFSFVIMMFNIPIPGGSTGHAVGGALVAVVLGPWAAFLAISIALIVQALLFGDGGITAVAANCFTMALVMPFSAWYVYRIVASGSGTASPRRIFAAGAAGYVSLNLSAFFTAVLLGVQPMLAHKPDGTPLYAPYPLRIAVPVMAAEHLIFFGFVEAVVTAMVVAYLARTEPSLLGLSEARPRPAAGRKMGTLGKLLAGLAVLIVLTPLGLIATGEVWGEWGSDELNALLGYVPEGLKRLEGIWTSLLPDYAVPGRSGPLISAAAYIFSAVLGVAAVTGVAWLIGRFLPSEEK